MLCDNLNKLTQLCDEPRKRRFCNAKQPLLPCKTYAFGMQNNRFRKTLVVRWLYNSHACEKYLQNNSMFLKGC
ncbi:hypothetical protein CBG55_11575 [Prevotella intermedia]|uniref:Uncharacterized protein n=1 Tax=Prevotella intermedia TaxID=28131 RepID=A0A2M8TKW1_PREIN|nr:hypothetical protein CBG55_11575 [Prevotella intermedia]PJI24568.1 hypothetical protein CTM59_09970 [Prevotella intermedia]